MSEPMPPAEVAYHLILEPEQAEILTQALDLLLGDEAHQPNIRRLAREVLASLDQAPPRAADDHAATVVALTAPQMKIVHTATRLLLDDTRREQREERLVLHSILDRLPDEHAIRAIQLP